ncbi:EamA family transporter, partial [Enterobacter hormaechei subsp. steigerwaltii]|nr:EamA family transporter [Enterobacter hormaechei subsp. steigerwaltii]MDS0114660.1 EamA family transporter [Enterobacter hormaechei subsp. steigerwaltii]
ALSISTVYEGYVWHLNGIVGLLLILGGNMVMFTKPETWFRRLRTA